MDVTATTRLLTLDGTYSFYVPGSRADLVRASASIADAVVAGGPAGPGTVRTLRSQGWEGTAIFDRADYVSGRRSGDIARWFDEQQIAGADRLLTPGCFISSESGHLSFDDQIETELELALAYEATCVLAIDYRWLTKSAQHDEMLHFLQSLECPIALVLADRGDPLGHSGAVNALVALTKRIENLSLLRIDHAGIGALAFEAVHASIGLSTTYRHAVPPMVTAHAIPHDRSARVFVLDLMDWHTASTIAGWSTTRVASLCVYSCCEGRRIDRFLDDRRKVEADVHNQTVLAALAEEILAIPESAGRRRAFGQKCLDAVERYGIMGGLTSEIRPSSQLEQWAQYA